MTSANSVFLFCDIRVKFSFDQVVGLLCIVVAAFCNQFTIIWSDIRSFLALNYLLAVPDDCIEADTRQTTKTSQKKGNKNVSDFETCRYNQAIIWNLMALNGFSMR